MKKQRNSIKIRARLALAALFLFALCAVFTACGTDDIDISGYENEVVKVSGISDQDVSFTITDLKEMNCITKKTESTSDKIGKVRATGVLLDTLLAEYDLSQDQFDQIKISASDDYDIKLDKDYLKENKVILAFGINGEPLDQESKPLRIIIPDSDSAYWVRKVQRIDLVKD